MKKSILQRSFKPAKCKTALKLAVSRIKLLKNKRDAQVKVMKRELAQLLQSGQDRTARIRVEHVVMEEKIMTAYELIDIYCELIAARLPIIESQKNCPIDLKEAIASVIYASPRCADIPELMDVRKQFTAKYGKEFVSAALELRPDCGVSRMLAEKLSAKAPDGPTKIKILSGIAEEHNIKWEPESFEEKELKPPNDLLNGPNTFAKSTEMHGEPPGVQTPSNHAQKGSPSNYSRPDQHAEHDAYSNFHQLNSGFSSHSQTVAPHVDSYNAMNHAAHPQVRPPGTPVEGSEYRHSYSRASGEPYKTEHNWNMEFKDATAAAQAAADSAERASMAARAAAELSSRGQNTTPYTVNSQQPSVNTRTDEVPQDHVVRNLQGEHSSVLSHHRQNESQNLMDSQFSSTGNRKEGHQYNVDSEQPSVNTRTDEVSQDYVGRNLQDDHPSVLSHHRQTASQNLMDSQFPSTGDRKEGPQDYVDRMSRDERPSGAGTSNNIHGNRNSEMQCNNSDEVEQDNLADVGERFHNDYSKTSNEPSGSPSHKYDPTTINDDSMRNPFWMEDNDASKNSFKPEKREYVMDMQYGVKSESVDAFLRQGIERQPSHVSYDSLPGNFSEDRDVLKPSNQTTGDYSGNKSFVEFDQDEYQERVLEKEASDKKSVAFDESGSDNDGEHMYDMMGDHKGQYSSMHFSSPDRIPPTHISESKNFSSPYEYIDNSPKASISGSQFLMNQHVSSVFSDDLPSPTIPSQPDDLPPAIFDDLDGSSSEEEEELHKVKLSESRSQKGNLTEGVNNSSTGTSFLIEENARSIGKLQLQSSSHSLDPLEENRQRCQEDELSNESHETFDSPISLSSRPLMSNRHSNELDGGSFNKVDSETKHVQDSSLESGKELNLGTLTGGLKNKGYRRAPYLKNSFGDSTYKQPIENHSEQLEAEPNSTSSVPAARRSNLSEATHQEPYIRKEELTSYKKSFDSDDDNSDDEFSKQTSNIKQQLYISKAGSGVRKNQGSRVRHAHTYFDSDSDEIVEEIPKQSLASKGRPAPARTYFDSDSDGSVEDLPKQSLASKGRPAPVFSRRTKASQTSEKSGSIATTKASLSSSAPRPLSSSQPQVRRSDYGRKFEQPTSANLAVTSKPIPEYKSSLDDRNFAPSENKQSTSTISKTTAGSSEGPKTSSSSQKILSRVDSTTSHVHPKLPEFDSFVAHMKSLHKNR